MNYWYELIVYFLIYFIALSNQRGLEAMNNTEHSDLDS